MARRQYVERKKNPLILICSEGGNNTSEKVYFSKFRTRNLRIQFSTGNSTDPNGMFDDLMNYIDREDIKNEDNCYIFLVIDTDLDLNRINKIKALEEKCRLNGINIVTSSPTFEIWYLMHFRNNSLYFTSSQEVKKELNQILNGKYKESMDMYPIIKDKTEYAINTAKNIKMESYETNPHSNVYIIIETINKFIV